mgnify:CR=1 FL=1
MQQFDLHQGDRIVSPNATANGVPGRSISVRTDLGNPVTAWQPAGNIAGDERFFCHGYSLGTFGRWGYTVWGGFMATVLADEYQTLGQLDRISRTAANQNPVVPGDILVWWLGGKDAYHSAVIDEPVYLPDGPLDKDNTAVGSKTGTGPLWRGHLARDVKEQYKPAAYIEVYRRNA